MTDNRIYEVFEAMNNVKLGDADAIREIHKKIDMLMDSGVITKQEHRGMCAVFTSVLRGKH